MSSNKTKDSICEEYYPISMEILQSFPKYRPQVDLFVFKEDIAQLYPIAQKNARLTNEALEEITEACKKGILFVSRSDQYIYVDLLAKQAELVLFNSHLLESEIVQILFQALEMRLTNLYEQPLENYYTPLYKDVMVFCEYLWKDPKNINAFLPKIAQVEEFKVPLHGVISLIVGAWLYFETTKKPNRKNFERLALGLLLHNIGLSKVPLHIVNKTSPLNKEETEKYQAHVRQGAILLNKFGIFYPATIDAIVQHHERIDGSGYPSKLAGNKISEFGCFSIVTNAFVDMLAPRHGVPKLSLMEALAKIAKDNSMPVNFSSVLARKLPEYIAPKA